MYDFLFIIIELFLQALTVETLQISIRIQEATIRWKT